MRSDGIPNPLNLLRALTGHTGLAVSDKSKVTDLPNWSVLDCRVVSFTCLHPSSPIMSTSLNCKGLESQDVSDLLANSQIDYEAKLNLGP